jgi:ligand-binding SRPBCC domain-containing protein
MKIHRIYRRQQLRMSMEQAWQFFSSPHNLNQITPSFFSVDITSPVPDDIYAGLMISYRMKAVLGIPMAWLSEVSHCEKPKRFIYQQRVGPFHFWSHEVSFTQNGEQTVLEDIVFYSMRWGWIGDLLHTMIIFDKLKHIFNVRQDYLQANWGAFSTK